METRSQSCLLSAGDKSVFLTKEPLSLERAVDAVRSPKHGAVVTFCGTVRDKEGNAEILSISYEAYDQMARKQMDRIVSMTKERWGVVTTIHHRVGIVPVNEDSLIVACGGVHRKETFEACSFVVDAIKKDVPIWKVGYGWV